MTGPTTTGSIDAKLTIDKSEWDVKVAEAKAEARELGSLSPTVKVDANVGPAIAKLAELASVERALEATNVRLAATEKALNQEQVQATSSALRLATVEKLLGDALKDAAGAAQRHAVAEEAGAAATEAAGDAAGRAAVKISSVAVAEQRLETAQRQAANSASTAYIANERLTAMREKGSASALQLAAAEEAVARADRNAEAAEKKHLAAVAALNAAKSEGAAKSLEQAAATDADTASTDRATQANNRRVSGIQVLIALSPLILAAAAPVAAAAVGLGSAFTVMGTAGVFAVKGIKDAMEDGGPVGNTYAAGIAIIKGNLDSLAKSSATAMLGGFSSAIGDINSRMPYLTQMTGEAAGALGRLGGTALSGVLTGLQQMNPLLQAGEVELGKFVTWLFSFTGSDGFTSFIGYAMDNLPGVMHLIESLVITAGHILSAFAPLGPAVVAGLTAISDGLNALPLPILTGLVTTAVLLAPALRLAFSESVAALIGKVAVSIGLTGAMANLAVPVVGILTAAIAGIGVAAAASALGTDQGTHAFQDYTQALKDDNLAIGAHVQAQMAKELVDDGAAQAGQRLGLSLQTVQQAAMGNEIAITAVKNVTDEAAKGILTWADGHGYASEKNKQLSGDVDLMRGSVLGASVAVQDQLGKQKLLKEMLEPTTGAVSEQAAATQILANRYGTTSAAYTAAISAQDAAKVSTDNQTVAMQLQNNAAGILKGSLDALNGKALSAAQAQNAFDSALANMGDHVSATGKKIHFTTADIGDMSAASVALRGQLNGQVTNLLSVVEANGGLSDSTGKARDEMATMRQQIIDNAVAHGVDKDAVTAYVDGLLKIPDKIPPTKLDIDAAAAQQKIDDIAWRLAMLQTHKTIFIDVQQSVSNVDNTGGADGTRPKLYAKGGQVNYLAAGGPPRFIPQGTDTVPAMLTPGEIVMNRASVASLGAGNLLHANKTGQWPASGGGGGDIAAAIRQGLAGVTISVQNPFTGEQVRGVVTDVVSDSLDGVSRQLGGMRR
jgi:hypothetical protein